MSVKEKQKTSTVESLPAHYREVLSLIGNGIDNPTTVKTISQLTGLRDQVIREIVSSLIVTHRFPIGTSNTVGNSGYYIITSDADRDATVANLRSRAFKILKRAAVIEAIPDHNQQEMDLV